MKKKIVVLLCAFMFWFQIPVHATSITLGDEGIRNAVQRALKSKENAFDLESLKGIEDLNRFPVRNTKSLDEFEYIPNLKKLMIMNSGVQDYTPLKHLNELKSLLITQFKKNDTQFDADVLKNIHLTQLGFQNINVVNPERLPNTIHDLSMVNTGMEDANFLSGYQELERLIVRDERINPRTLSLNHPQLQYLTLDSLGLESLPDVDQLNRLVFANFKNNELKNVDSLKTLPRLKELDLSKNRISNFSYIPNSVTDLKAFDQVTEVDLLEHEGVYSFKNPFKWIDGDVIKPDIFSDEIKYDDENHQFTLKNLDLVQEIRFLKKDLSDGEKVMTGRLKIGRIVKTSPLIPLQPMPKVNLPQEFMTSIGNPYLFESLLKDHPDIQTMTLDVPVNYDVEGTLKRNLNIVFKSGHVVSHPITIVITSKTSEEEKNTPKHDLDTQNRPQQHEDKSHSVMPPETKSANKSKTTTNNKVEPNTLPLTGVSERDTVSHYLIVFGMLLLVCRSVRHRPCK
ncbi:leucine-rich repeat domain-containing protein [Erysipelothrix rhusiopathiae]|nr:leucine-rich repeat domain-containing protein [Erysipelothrix rhusiopathiae]MDE8294011.1 leucine-rich repeat domain-containing protein [Erysipelothrix rhusiopathiae]MDE8298773.1 leucine-rich repeat domain-containing protein [Erysipelothrix rhusiopathiae]